MSGRIEDLYHIGLVVEDFEGTCERLAKTSGVTWSPVIGTTLKVWTPDGEIEGQFKAVYSVDGPPHYEVVQPVPGTVIAAAPGKPLHHLGYWTTDMVGDSARLAAAGNPLVLAVMHEGKPAGMAYHAMPDGTYLELVDRAAYDDWDGFLRGDYVFESKF